MSLGRRWLVFQRAFRDILQAFQAQVAAVSPQPPAFLYEADWFIEGSAQEVLPQLAAALSRRP